MFGRKQKQEEVETTSSYDMLNHVGKGTTIDGGMSSNSSLRVDGRIKGTVTVSERLILGSNGSVEGKIVCKDADISGEVLGDIAATGVVRLTATARINGDLKIAQLVVETGAAFNGNCIMTTSSESGSATTSSIDTETNNDQYGNKQQSNKKEKNTVQ